jgi:hypothetical protein
MPRRPPGGDDRVILRMTIPVPTTKVPLWSVTLATTGKELGILIADSRDEALDAAALMAESKGLAGERLTVRRTNIVPSKAPLPGATKVVEFTAASQTKTEELEEPMQKVLDALGHPEAAVSDESSVHDFLETEGIRRYRRGRAEAFLPRRDGPWRWERADPRAPTRNTRKLRRLEERLGFPVDREDLLIVLARRVRDMGLS